MEKNIKKQYNILFISSFGDLKGGGQRSLLLLLKYLNKQKFIPLVIVPEKGEVAQELEKMGMEVIVLSFPRIRSINTFKVLAALFKLKSIVKAKEIDIIHADSPRETAYAGIVRFFLKVRVILHLRVSDKVSWIDKIVYQLTDRMIAVSRSLTFRFKGMDKKNKISVVYNAVDLDEFKPLAYKQDENKTLRIGYFGRIVKRKGIDVLIKACMYFEGEISLLIMGSGEEKYIAELKKMAEIDKRIEFKPYQQNIRDEINTVDMVVLPSVQGEGLSRIIIEAMAMGKIAIVSNHPENLEALGYDLKKFAFKNNDEKDLARIINKIRNNKGLQDSIRLVSRKRAEHFFDARKNTVLIENIYYSILGKKDEKNKKQN
ncbi:MAG: glycosyltransferase [Candidatus Omnitrophica bacterium]|nr:glycosyltransferase [Candidatus Omnitrophota bacterium]